MYDIYDMWNIRKYKKNKINIFDIMSISNIEKINNHFKLPIFFNDNKMELNKNIITDLELIKTIDTSACNPIYNYAFQPKTIFANKIIEQVSTYYTTDTKFLKDTQNLITNYTPINKDNDNNCIIDNIDNSNSSIMEIWDEIKNDTGFKDKYHYIDWSMWEHLNKSEYFLQIMSIYNLASPIISLCIPFIILIIPFIIIQIKGLKLNIAEYIEILKSIASTHAIGKLFTKFNSVKTDEKLYLLLSALFYVFSIYQNILSCIRFHNNMKKIHSYIDNIKIYIKNTESKMYNFLSFSDNLSTYKIFNDTLKEKMFTLALLKDKLEKIIPYGLSYKKISDLGNILKHFYDIYNDVEYNDTFLYSFGFNGYIDVLEGLVENIHNNYINLAKFTKNKKNTMLKNSYYPALIYDNPIKNTFKLNKNMIITGPNASGKTTTLKTALINIIFTQQFGCGFYESAIIKPYTYIHCYLNIPDTSGRDSLFQAEARRCKEIIDIIKENTSKKNHFCVFDELYSGTNPDDAVLSAHAFMKYLIKYKNINCILTTHFIELCKKLNDNDSIENYHMKTIKMENENAENAENDFKYTYLLKKGISTVRGGIKILNDMDYPKEIIDNTR